MPRRSEGARLYLRVRSDRPAVWVIRDAGGIEQSTGTGSRQEAEKALARYISTRGMPSGATEPENLTVGRALTIYIEGHAVTAADPDRISFAVEALTGFWGDKAVSAVKGATCRRYLAGRFKTVGGKAIPVSPATVRRELGTLQAALNYCVREGWLTHAPLVTLPDKSPPKDRWLTRDEMAWLLRGARALKISGRHLVRFILTCRYTGTRKEAALGLRIDQPSVNAGWVDTAQGVLYRQGTGARRTKKRQTPARLPEPFLGHLRRWKALGARFVVQDYRGHRIGDIKTGWASACERAQELAGAKGVEIDLSDATPHTLRHTAITWAMQRGAAKWDVSGYFGVSMETLESTYGHHHPDHQSSAVEAMSGRDVGAKLGRTR